MSDQKVIESLQNTIKNERARSSALSETLNESININIVLRANHILLKNNLDQIVIVKDDEIKKINDELKRLNDELKSLKLSDEVNSEELNT